MSLEEQLLHCLDVNLKHKGEVIEKYGSKFDLVSDYSLNNGMAESLASAINHAEKTDAITKEDLHGYKALHTAESVKSFEDKFGLKSFLLDFEIPKDKWLALAEKANFPEWHGGFYYPAYCFRKFNNSTAMFHEFGFALEMKKARYVHEAMHCAARFYLADHYDRKLLDFNPDYSGAEIMARAELDLSEEILCFMAESYTADETLSPLKTRYFSAQVSRFLVLYSIIGMEERNAKKQEIESALEPVKNSIEITVQSAFKLASLLEWNLLAPLFMSVGPTKEQFAKKDFYSAFGDICLWANALDKGRIKSQAIKETLQKKGYCLEKSLF